MTSEETSNPKETEPPIDTILQFLVALANSGGFSTAVTLSIKGTIITGDLVGFKQYMNSIALKLRNPDSVTSPQIRSPPEPGDEDDVRRSLETIASGLDTIQTEMEKRTELPVMIHLKNVEIIGPIGKIILPSDVIWRGQLHTIDGFVLGKMGQ
jgi:hypothetical protein